jgi:dimethylhistidine N-methyltransferase
MMDGDLALEPLDELVEAPSRGAPSYDFAEAVLAGLSRNQKSIPCRFFYDARGSELFEQITSLPEYYPTRVETELLRANAAEIAWLAGADRVVVEFGSGSSRKTNLLLHALRRLRGYVPIDIAGECLHEAATWLKHRHPNLAIEPMIADFTNAVTLPPLALRWNRLGFFSGSTIGNLNHNEGVEFLANASRLLGKDGLLLIGVDLKKPSSILIPAYNDAKGVTAEFNLNLLRRINRELGGNFNLDRFAHDAIYDEEAGRIEMNIVSLAAQTVRVLHRDFRFAEGERIHTENSHKYSIPQFQSLAKAGGWRPVGAWTDADQLFSLHLLRLR